MFMLIDCDNFFVSCERVFQPSYHNRPVVVLSNNDGCVVSRSYEAKNMGIAMCSPYFKVERQLKAANGVALSSNYELYADISRRIMNYLRQNFGDIEIYSIDEAFIKIPHRQNFFSLASKIRREILQFTGIPVSIGIAQTKTLCKIAGHFAKKQFKLFQLTSPEQLQEYLQKTDVSDIWGVGRHLNAKLNHLGIFTAADLAQAPRQQIRSACGINLEKTVMELNQIPCFDIEMPSMAKSIISSGSFEHEIQNKEKLAATLAEFVDCACLRLRQQKAQAGGIWIELHSNRFSTIHPQYNNAELISLPQPSDNTAHFMTAMRQGLEKIYQPKYWYKRAGVTLVGLETHDRAQSDFWHTPQTNPKDNRLMQAFDSLNQKFGRKTIFFATQQKTAKQHLKREFKSPEYTTNWQDIPLVN